VVSIRSGVSGATQREPLLRRTETQAWIALYRPRSATYRFALCYTAPTVPKRLHYLRFLMMRCGGLCDLPSLDWHASSRNLACTPRLITVTLSAPV
jgi:hypothetical protein